MNANTITTNTPPTLSTHPLHHISFLQMADWLSCVHMGSRAEGRLCVYCVCVCVQGTMYFVDVISRLHQSGVVVRVCVRAQASFNEGLELEFGGVSLCAVCVCTGCSLGSLLPSVLECGE